MVGMGEKRQNPKEDGMVKTYTIERVFGERFLAAPWEEKRTLLRTHSYKFRKAGILFGSKYGMFSLERRSSTTGIRVEFQAPDLYNPDGLITAFLIRQEYQWDPCFGIIIKSDVSRCLSFVVSEIPSPIEGLETQILDR